MEKDSSGCTTARVVAQYRGKYRIKTGDKELWAEVVGKLIYRAISPLDYPVVGDLVNITELGSGHAVIEEILPRNSILKRKASGKDELQPIAANVDVAFVVQAADRDFNLNRLERYLTLIKAGRIRPGIILNKSDLISKEELEDNIARVKDRFKDCEVLSVSAANRTGMDNLLNAIKEGQIYCFVGSSGVGKSSIINRLLGKNLLKTKSISATTKKGKHCTTHRELFVLYNGGMVIDNPGMREVGVADAGEGMDEVFGDIADLSGECKFSDCTHQHEAGCAVLAALKSGQLDEGHYSNYIKIKKESDYYAMSGLEKRRKDRNFGRMVKSLKKQKPIKFMVNILILLLLLLPLISVSCGQSSSNSTSSPSSTTTPFCHYVADLSKIKYINQPGNSDQIVIKDRCYLAIKNTETTIEVYAPATAEVLGIAYYTVRSDNVPEYALYFKVSSTCYYFFAHLIDISSKLKAVGPSAPQPTSGWIAPTSPESVSAGELIAFTEGTLQARTFDFGAYDPSHKNSVANESRYSADDRYLTGVNPYLYYPESMRTNYLVLSANPAGTVVATTECRSVCRDVSGTASGYWYLTSGTDATYQEKMHIISEPDESVYWGGVGGGGYELKTAARTPLNPEKLEIGIEYGYSGPSGYLYLKLFSSTEMGVYFSTTDPGSFPGSGYKTYSR